MKVAWIGTGLIGFPMAERLLKAGYEVIAYNRTRARAEALARQGAQVANTPAEAVAGAECVILTLLDGPAIEQTVFAAKPQPDFSGRTVIQMGTILPEESETIRRRIVDAGGDYLEAPVLGSIPEARQGKLIVMVGATEAQFRRWQDLLKQFGPPPVWVGKVGQAAAMKLALNQLIASLISAFSLSIGMIRRRRIDVETFMNVLRQSALYAPTFDKKLPRLLERNFANPNFPTKSLLKDVNLILKEARSLGLETTALEGVRAIIEQAVNNGFADTDYSSVYNAIDPQE